jgi:hypothetical protein
MTETQSHAYAGSTIRVRNTGRTGTIVENWMRPRANTLIAVQWDDEAAQGISRYIEWDRIEVTG